MTGQNLEVWIVWHRVGGRRLRTHRYNGLHILIGYVKDGRVVVDTFGSGPTSTRVMDLGVRATWSM
jgi:hypothetical protein